MHSSVRFVWGRLICVCFFHGWKESIFAGPGVIRLDAKVSLTFVLDLIELIGYVTVNNPQLRVSLLCFNFLVYFFMICQLSSCIHYVNIRPNFSEISLLLSIFFTFAVIFLCKTKLATSPSCVADERIWDFPKLSF